MMATAFEVLPALDVLEGRCVRLAEGERSRVTVEGGEPEAAAARFVREGARFLHLVDLDGAFAGAPTPGLIRRSAEAGVERLLVTATRRDGSLTGPDYGLLEEVLSCGLPVLAAGGIASLADLRGLRDLGCEGAVVGSALWLGRFTLADALRVGV